MYIYIYIICYYVLLFLQGFHTFLELRGFWDISRSSGTSKSAWWSRSFVELGPHPELRCRSLAISAVSAVVLVVPTAVHFFHEAFYPTSLWIFPVLLALILDWIVRHLGMHTDWTFAFAQIPHIFDSRGVVQRVHLDGKVDVLLGCPWDMAEICQVAVAVGFRWIWTWLEVPVATLACDRPQFQTHRSPAQPVNLGLQPVQVFHVWREDLECGTAGSWHRNLVKILLSRSVCAFEHGGAHRVSHEEQRGQKLHWWVMFDQVLRLVPILCQDSVRFILNQRTIS